MGRIIAQNGSQNGLAYTVMDTDKAWAADIQRMRYIGNFIRWQNDTAYQRTLARLLRDLKSTTK